MSRLFLSAYSLLILILTAPALAQTSHENPLPTTSASHTQIVLLGTGTPRADPQRSGPATAVVVNLTGIQPSQLTYLTVFPGPTIPFSSDLNPAVGEVRANLVVATVPSP